MKTRRRLTTHSAEDSLHLPVLCWLSPVHRLQGIKHSEASMATYLNSHQHFLLIARQAVTFCQEDLAKCPLSQLPLQDDVVSFDVLDDCGTEKEQCSLHRQRRNHCDPSVNTGNGWQSRYGNLWFEKPDSVSNSITSINDTHRILTVPSAILTTMRL